MTRRIQPIAIAVCLALSAVAVARAASPPATTYIATLVDDHAIGLRTSSLPITIRLDRLTTGEEDEAVATAARSGKENVLRDALRRNFVGRIEINGRLGDPISYATRTVDQDGTHLLLIAPRALSPREIFRGWWSVDYPFVVVELDLRPDGTGSGHFYAATRIRTRKDGDIALTDLFFFPSRLMAVKTVAG